MRCNTEKKDVVIRMSAREAGKMAENLKAMDAGSNKMLGQLKALFESVPVPESTRAEVRHEYSDALDMDPDIGPA